MHWKSSIGIALLAIGLPGAAAAETCELTITGNDQLQYNKSELVVGPECDQVKVTLEHVGEAPVEQMGHNWVLSKTGDLESLAQAASQAGLDNEYIPQGDERVIAHTGLVGGGETTAVTFDADRLESGGDYTYFCSFPGHYSIMQGKLIVE